MVYNNHCVKIAMRVRERNLSDCTAPVANAVVVGALSICYGGPSTSRESRTRSGYRRLRPPAPASLRPVAIRRPPLSIAMQQPTTKRPVEIIDFADVAPVACPCGTARRALAEVEDFPGTIHRTDISADARVHYHKRLTEVYYILECGPQAQMELDGERVAVSPGMCIMIRPLVRHRAIGEMKVLVIVYPKFDPSDEWFD